MAIATTGLAGATASNTFAQSNQSAAEAFELILQTNYLQGHLEERLTHPEGRVHENKGAGPGPRRCVRARGVQGPPGRTRDADKRIKYATMVLGNNDFRVPPARTRASGALVGVTLMKSDDNVVLSHAGKPEDHNIAKLAGVDAVIGADTHKVIRTPETQVNAEGNIVPITQAGGEQEHYLGRLDLTFSLVNGEYVLTDHSGFLYDLDGVQPDQRILDLIASYR